MIADMIIKIINMIILAIGTVINGVLSLLPDSPFKSIQLESIDTGLIKALNWIIPVNTIISIFGASLLAVGVYYLYQIVLRWIKAIE